MNMQNFCGIDIGCTNIKLVAIVNNTPTFKSTPSGDNLSREELIKIIHDFCLSFNCKFDGLGIAFSGCTKNSKVVDTTTLKCAKH